MSSGVENIFGYHPGTEVTIPKHEETRSAFIAFAKMLDEQLPAGRAKAVVLTKLQEASMWANFAIAELAPLQGATTSEPPAPPALF